jgi:spore germination protein GerM
MNNKKIWIVLIVIFFLAGVSGSYFLMRRFALREKPAAPSAALQNTPADAEDLFTLRIFYPVDNRLQLIEKRLPRRSKQAAVAEAVIEGYLKGPENGKISPIPQNVKLLGLFRDPKQVLYIDLSDEARRNFQGDALAEYLFLKGLYESLIANLTDIQDVKILVEGKEIETLGGHIYLKYPLKSVVSYEFRGETKFSGE